MVRILILSLTLSSWMTPQDDPALTSLRSTLQSMRATATPSFQARGYAAMETAKHQLRDWIESELPPWGPGWNSEALSEELNAKLNAAGLFCSEGQADPCRGDFESIGYLYPIEVYHDGLLRIKTGLGIICGADESAYLYKWIGSKWLRVWETERNDYSKDRYDPQVLHSVIVSYTSEAAGVSDDHLVLTLGTTPQCASSWHSVFYRLWRVNSKSSTLLVDGRDDGYLGADPPMMGGIRPKQPDMPEGFDSGNHTCEVIAANLERAFLGRRLQDRAPGNSATGDRKSRAYER